MSKLLALLVLTCFSSSAVAETPEQNIVAIRAKMLELTGSSAIECGLVQFGDSSRAPWQCAQDADKIGRPFWFALEGRRTDSAIWRLLLRAPSGKRYVVFYTSNDQGQPEFVPHFDVTECHRPFKPVENTFFGVNCGPDVP